MQLVKRHCSLRVVHVTLCGKLICLVDVQYDHLEIM
jgi:hypothetical protein